MNSRVKKSFSARVFDLRRGGRNGWHRSRRGCAHGCMKSRMARGQRVAAIPDDNDFVDVRVVFAGLLQMLPAPLILQPDPFQVLQRFHDIKVAVRPLEGLESGAFGVCPDA